MSAKIGILTAIWGRPRLTELVLGYYENQNADYRHVVCSQEDEDPLLSYGFDQWDWSYALNRPLSDKWSKGLDWIHRNQPIDAVLIVGSDDLVTPQYIEACRYLIEGGADYITLPGAYFYDTESRRMFWGWSQRLGLGRCISRRLLDRLDWNLWPEGLDKGLDGAMHKRISELSGVRSVCLNAARSYGYIGLDIKTAHNIWPFDFVRANLMGYDVDAEEELRKWFPDVADELLNWNEKAIIEND